MNSLSGEEAASTPAESAGGEDSYQGLKVSKDKKLLRIQLNRPTKKNALTWEVCKESDALQEHCQTPSAGL